MNKLLLSKITKFKLNQQTLPHIVRSLFLMFGVTVTSTSVIMIKASTEHPFLVAAYRLFIATAILSPLFFRELKKSSPNTYTWKQVSWSALPALVLALHFMSWIIGARMTPVSNASLLINLTPTALPFFLWLFYREKVSGKEILGSIFAVSGVFLLTGFSFAADSNTFWGNLICLGSMLTFACYMALGRKNGARLSLWLYIVPLYFIAGLICFAAALFLINPIKPYSLDNILYIIGLAIFPTVMGHSIINYSLKHFRGQVVGVANLGQPILSTIIAVFVFGEIPKPIFYVSALLVFAGVLIAILSSQPQQTTDS